jgi:release factor glutamine methyltransferase
MSEPESGLPPQASQGRDASQKSWTVLELLRWTTQYFDEKGIESARLDAECLLASALGMERLGLYLEFEKPVSSDERGRFRELVKRRGQDRVPVSQLLGHKEFWSLDFKVTADVLTPRPETELLVSTALEELRDREQRYRIFDLGTGSGAIALALAKELPTAEVVASDISFAALQIATLNAEELHLNEAVKFTRGSLFEPVAGERFDLVVSNPPYLAGVERSSLPPELSYEPEVALFGGEDGLEVLRAIATQAGEFLVPGGILLLEMDPRQVDEMVSCCATAGFSKVEVQRDLAHRERAVLARKALTDVTS